MGKCRVEGVDDDFITTLLAEGARQEEPWKRVLMALKERLVTVATLSDEEGAAMEALLGVDLEATVPGGRDAESTLRLFCGALLASPQFLLQGLPPQPPAERPETLWIEGASGTIHCRTWRERLPGLTCPE